MAWRILLPVARLLTACATWGRVRVSLSAPQHLYIPTGGAHFANPGAMCMYASNGTTKWFTPLTVGSLTGNAPLTPALSADEKTVYFHAGTGFLFAVDAATGTIKWNVTTASSVRQGFYSSPTVDEAGNMCVGAVSACLCRAPHRDMCCAALTLSRFLGTCCSYVAGHGGASFNVIQAVAPSGKTLWVSPVLGGQPATVGVDEATKRVVLGCNTDGGYGTTAWIYALDMDTGTRLGLAPPSAAAPCRADAHTPPCDVTPRAPCRQDRVDCEQHHHQRLCRVRPGPASHLQRRRLRRCRR